MEEIPASIYELPIYETEREIKRKYSELKNKVSDHELLRFFRYEGGKIEEHSELKSEFLDRFKGDERNDIHLQVWQTLGNYLISLNKALEG